MLTQTTVSPEALPVGFDPLVSVSGMQRVTYSMPVVDGRTENLGRVEYGEWGHIAVIGTFGCWRARDLKIV